jgi:predicted HTH domain antitoxin
MTEQTINPSLSLAIDQYRAGAISLDQARKLIRAWPAYLGHELAEKARALRMLATTQPEAGPSGKKAAQG